MKILISLLLAAAASPAQLVPDVMLRELLSEISVRNALEHTRRLASHSRYANSASFFEAAEYVAARAREYGLQNVRVERFETRQPSWDPVEGELELIAPERRLLASVSETPLLAAQYSASGEVTAELVDVGHGTAFSDYLNKNVRGKILLADGPPSAVWKAMGDRGAAGLLSAASGSFFGRRTAPDAVLWSRAPASALAMMIPPSQGEALRSMLRRGEMVTVRMRLRTKETQPGAIGMVMGEIPGDVVNEDVVLVAHLDHQHPGANDNASGSGTLLEVLAALHRLVESKKIPPPRRTLRFWWSTEIWSEREYFRNHPEEAEKILMAVNLDQAGGDRNSENNFVVIYGPDWLPSYTDDLIHNLAEHMKENYAPAEHEPSPLFVAPAGSRQSFRTVYWNYAPLSDHIAFQAKGVGIPCISMAVPSLHVIHSSEDTVDRLDPTWMKRSALMMLAPALFGANAGPDEAADLLEVVFRRARLRLAASDDPMSLLRLEEKRIDSVRAFDPDLATESYKERLRALAAALK